MKNTQRGDIHRARLVHADAMTSNLGLHLMAMTLLMCPLREPFYQFIPILYAYVKMVTVAPV